MLCANGRIYSDCVSHHCYLIGHSYRNTSSGVDFEHPEFSVVPDTGDFNSSEQSLARRMNMVRRREIEERLYPSLKLCRVYT